MAKRLSIFAAILLLVGITGAIFTLKSQMKPSETLEKTTIDATDFTNIDIHTRNAEVVIMPTDEEQATVELVGNEKDYTYEAQAEGGALEVELGNKQKLFTFGWYLKLSLHIYLPEKVYENIQIENNNGRIELSDLQSNKVNVITHNGRVRMNDMESDVLFAETHNGRVDMKSIDANLIKVRSHNGRLNLANVRGNLEGETHNGRIELITEDLDRPIELRTDNGKIEIQSNQKPTNAVLDLQTDNGKVRFFGEKNWDTVIGDGDNVIKLTSGNGNVTVK